jgi:hypothetical protein
MKYIDYDMVIEGNSIELDSELTGKLLSKFDWAECDQWEMRIVGNVITLFRLEKE